MRRERVKCRHSDRVTKIIRRNFDGRVVYRRCDCGHYLSLGPANVTPEVEVEIRAAELALTFHDESEWNGFESLGMCSDGEHAPLIERDIAERNRHPHDLAAYLAGYLARCIVEGDGK